MGLKQLRQAARMVLHVVHGVDQRRIAQLGTTVNEALCKDLLLITIFFIDAKTLILASPELHARVANAEIRPMETPLRVRPYSSSEVQSRLQQLPDGTTTSYTYTA